MRCNNVDMLLFIASLALILQSVAATNLKEYDSFGVQQLLAEWKLPTEFGDEVGT